MDQQRHYHHRRRQHLHYHLHLHTHQQHSASTTIAIAISWHRNNNCLGRAGKESEDVWQHFSEFEQPVAQKNVKSTEVTKLPASGRFSALKQQCGKLFTYNRADLAAGKRKHIFTVPSPLRKKAMLSRPAEENVFTVPSRRKIMHPLSRSIPPLHCFLPSCYCPVFIFRSCQTSTICPVPSRHDSHPPLCLFFFVFFWLIPFIIFAHLLLSPSNT